MEEERFVWSIWRTQVSTLNWIKRGREAEMKGQQTNLTQEGKGGISKLPKNQESNVLFPVNLVCSGGMKGHWVGGAVWLFCLSKEIGERLLPLEREEIGKNTGI